MRKSFISIACDHRLWWCAACDGRRCEDSKIGVAAREAIEGDLLIPYGCKLTAQERERCHPKIFTPATRSPLYIRY